MNTDFYLEVSNFVSEKKKNIFSLRKEKTFATAVDKNDVSLCLCLNLHGNLKL